MLAPKREKLLETAEAIFAKEGFKGISVDRVLREAGVAKMTLYKGFDGKDALIQETLRRRGDRIEAHLEQYTGDANASPEDRILSVFDAMQDWSERPEFNGCYFVNALTEYGASGGEIGELARAYKQRFLDFLNLLCIEVSVVDPEDTSRILFMMIEGATVSRMSLDDPDSFARAKKIAAKILKHHSSH